MMTTFLQRSEHRLIKVYNQTCEYNTRIYRVLKMNDHIVILLLPESCKLLLFMSVSHHAMSLKLLLRYHLRLPLLHAVRLS